MPKQDASTVCHLLGILVLKDRSIQKRAKPKESERNRGRHWLKVATNLLLPVSGLL